MIIKFNDDHYFDRVINHYSSVMLDGIQVVYSIIAGQEKSGQSNEIFENFLTPLHDLHSSGTTCLTYNQLVMVGTGVFNRTCIFQSRIGSEFDEFVRNESNDQSLLFV